jgi:hypothetical protein
VTTRAACVLLVVAATLAGCGLGPGPTRGRDGVQLRVTRDFGHKLLATGAVAKVRASDTVMRLLQSKAKITTRYGGRFVQSIDGLEGTQSGGPHDWFYFVNGTEAPTGATAHRLDPGDVVQWDYRDWRATPHVPAIVGAFPEPFAHGLEGTRYPTRIECANGEDACATVQGALDRAGVPAGTGTLGSEARGGILRIQVGEWSVLERIQELDPLEKGPAASGVYARFGADGLELLDSAGHVVRKAPPGTGLVAALIPKGQKPLWVVTGVDEAGVARAAALLDESKLRNAYAVAATPSGPLRLPLEAGG